MRRFELVRGLTRRFWHVVVEGSHVTVTTGIAGMPAQPLTATFPTPQAALAEQERLVKERLGWGYVELEPSLPLVAPAEPESDELPANLEAPAGEPERAPARAVAAKPAEDQAARASAARKTGGAARPRRSGPSKKLMGLPSQALALTVKSTANRKVRRDAMLTLVAQTSADTPRWVAESLVDTDLVIRAAAEEYFAPAHLDAAATSGTTGESPGEAGELAPPAKEASLPTLPPGLNDGAKANEAGSFWSAAALARPQLEGGAGAVPLDAVRTLVELMRTAPDSRASFVRWRQTCTASSLEDFAWSVVRAFIASGAAPEDAWALRGLVAFGGD